MALSAGRVGVRPDQVDLTGKVIGAGGGDKELVLAVDELCKISSPNTTTEVSLSASINDYAFIIANGYGTYSGVSTKCGNIYPSAYLKANDTFGVSNDVAVIWYKVIDDKTIKGSSVNMPSPCEFRVYGVKLKEVQV